ncbi:MBL fold metallo-hydrolase [Micromonospora sp. NPDC050417]|uniref:MBL fold metallo-hydrolase n=1 Tax=Micromonospora sp. NPDC050417 TaxID=3364280 RepID=UPI003797ABC2
MTRTPGRLLATLTGDAARAVLRSGVYAGERIDHDRFATANRSQLLTVIARVPALRAELAARYADELAGGHPLLRQLTDPDPAVAREAAALLGNDPGALARAVEASAPPKRAPRAAASVEERRAERAVRHLAEVRAARDQARGQLDWAVRERDALRQELAAAVTDRDEALAVIESLRAELDSRRRQSTALAGSLGYAAGLLAGLLAPAADNEALDPDPRERDRNGVHGPDRDVAAEPVATRERLAAALAAANVGREAFLAVLEALRAPAPSPVPVASSRPREMALTPLGGGTDIGGSCMLVEVGDVRILVDAGLRPKQPIDRAGPPDIGIARAGRLDAIVITHAHSDHAGYVPALVADDPSLPLLCTQDTAALLPTMWADSVRVFDRLRQGYLPAGEPAVEPPYGQAQVVAAQRRIRPTEFGRVVEVADGVTVELFPAGHILGAAGVVISAGATRVTVTGDVSDLAQATVPGLVVPDRARGSDLLVIESTYCRPTRSRRGTEVENFIATVAETVASGGRVLVPAFALGRAQEVALTLRNRLPDVPVLIDGMARRITRIYEQQTADGDNPLRIYGDQVREVAPEQRRELIAAFRRGVIVTTSGMLTAGPAVVWGRSILPDPTAALLLAGHQDEESPGAALLDLAEGRESTFVLDTESVDVKARIAKFGLSAHADRTGLSSIVDDVAAAQVMLVHGLPGAQREFGAHLRRRGQPVVPTDRWQSRPSGPSI